MQEGKVDQDKTGGAIMIDGFLREGKKLGGLQCREIFGTFRILNHFAKHYRTAEKQTRDTLLKF